LKKELRQLSKETAIYGISTIISRFLNFLLVPIFTNVFSQSEYGIITNIYAYIAFLNIIYLYGMESAYLKFASTQEFGNEKQTFSTTFNSVLITSIIFTMILFILAGSFCNLFGLSENQIEIVYLSAGILSLDAISMIVFAKLRFYNKAFKFALIKTIGIILNVILNIYLILILKLGIEGVFWANFIASLTTLILLVPSLIKNYEFKFYKSLHKELLKFGLPFVPSGIAAVINHVVDRPILLALTDASTLGIYQANYKLGIFMMLYVSMFQYAWQPFYLKQAQREDAKEIFASVLTYFLIVGSIIFIFLSLFVDDLVKIKIVHFYLIGKEFWGGIYIVPIILFAYLLNGVYINFIAGLQITKRTEYLPLVTGVGAFVNVTSNFLLIPILGMMGAAFATLFSYLSMAIFQYFLSQKFYPIKYEWHKILILLLITTLTYFGYQIVLKFLPDWKIYLKLASFVSFLTLLFAFKIVKISSLGFSFPWSKKS